ncbi:unnamed protein product, partial [Cyprideis torosa]
MYVIYCLVTSSLANACSRGKCLKWTDCLGSFYGAPEPCQLDGGVGVCCDFEDDTPEDQVPIPQPRVESNFRQELLQRVDFVEIDDFVAAATAEYRRYLKHNKDLIRQGNFPAKGSTHGMLDKYKRLDPETKRVAEMGLIFLETSKLLAKKDRDVVYDDLTVFYMQWGQHLNHDKEATFAFGLDVSAENNVFISCCTPWGQVQNPLPHFACYPIEIPVDDSFYGQYGQRCMNFVRSNLAPCRLGHAEQLNGATPLLDIGHIYGNDKKKVDSLRTFEDGRMKSTVFKGYYELMPECEKGVPDGCFETGDFRYDVVPALALHHTLHLRSHNRLAHALQQMNPHWSDERLFQEARRINIAVHQHVTFNEYLPILIGEFTNTSPSTNTFPSS